MGGGAGASPIAHGAAGTVFHGTSIALAGAGCLILGASGSGKSALALDLISRGARLIADDRARVALQDGWPILLAPERHAGVIEARGVGLLAVAHQPAAPLRLVVDLDTPETDRLPEPRRRAVLGVPVDLVHRVDGPQFSPAIWALLTAGRVA